MGRATANIKMAMVEARPLDAREKAQQIENMRSFILHEARQKALEIADQCEKDFAAQKQMLLDSARVALQREYEERTDKVNQESNIRFSTIENEQKMKLLSAKTGIIKTVYEETANKLKASRGDSKVIAALISQGLDSFPEGSSVKVQCSKQDQSAVRSACDMVGGVTFDGSSIGSSEACTLTQECLGGVILSNEDDTVIVDQTFNARLQIAMETVEPIVKPLLFKEGGSKHFN